MKRVAEDFQDGGPEGDFSGISKRLWSSMVASLREIRMARRISLRELAKRVGVHSTHLSRMEKDITVPNVVVVIQWSLALGIDFGRLYHATVLDANGEDDKIG